MAEIRERSAEGSQQTSPVESRRKGRFVITLLLWFLGISVIPLVIVSVVNYRGSYNALRDEAALKLSSALNNRKREIQDFLSMSLADLLKMAKRRTVLTMVKDFSDTFRASRMKLSEFVKSREWLLLADKYEQDIGFFVSSSGFHDLFIIDTLGNVLFTDKREDDLGTNLFAGKHSNTHFAKSCRKTLNNEMPVFSDLEKYGPSGNVPACFLVSLILDEDYRKTGLIAAQLSNEMIDRIMQAEAGIGETAETYLVGSDLRMRSNSRLEKEPTILGEPVETEQTLLWLKNNIESECQLVEKAGQASVYTGRRGMKVFGLHKPVEIAGVRMGVLAEVPVNEAFAAATAQRNIAIFSLVLTIFLIAVFAFIIARRITQPVTALAGWAQQVAVGNLSFKKIQAPDNEFGQMNKSFGEVVRSFQSIVRQANTIAEGDLSSDVQVRSEKDELGAALQNMTATLRDVVKQASTIAGGDYTVAIAPRSEKDELGIALNVMTKTLKQKDEETNRLINNLNSIPTPVFAIDRAFTINYMNPAGASFAGMRVEEAVGMKCYDLFKTGHCGTPECRSTVAMKTGAIETAETETAAVGRRGHSISIRYTGAPIKDAEGRITGALEYMIDVTETKRAMDEIQLREWQRTGQVELNNCMRGDISTSEMARNVVKYLCNKLDAQIGAFYVLNNGVLRLAGSYAYTTRKELSNTFKLGEGLAGESALEKETIVLEKAPSTYFKISSGLGEDAPKSVLVSPFIYNDRVMGVVEIGSFKEFCQRDIDFIKLASENVGIALASAEARTRTAELLEETQRQAEELQAQQEELKTANEELEEQTRRLKDSEEKLKAQQEELEVTNEELEEKNEMLQRQTREVERARRNIEEKAEELALASKYKSEFLANMSHELRTPLNSLLLLAQDLSQNKRGNLTEDQVESAKIIHGSGIDLLNLLNEILDLSKIEAGRMELQVGLVRVSELAEAVSASFQCMAQEKGLGMEVVVGEDTPIEITSDRKRVEQVIRNLVANAVKFTERGSVTVTFGRPAAGTDLSRSGLAANECLAVAVKDTGIGISPQQQKIIFEAFQQAEGGTARKYGGTGLGLSISRELARLLGGEIQLESAPGEGSTFTLYLPVEVGTRSVERGTTSSSSIPSSEPRVPTWIPDDREQLRKDDRIILVIEDDPNFAKVLCDKCHEKGFKCLAAPTGEAGLELAAKYLPGAVILDIRLPGVDGWTVLNALKDDTRTRHIPVHVVSVEEASTESLRKGAVGHVVKPLDQEVLEEVFRRLEEVAVGKPRRVLVVEDDAEIRRRTLKLIGNGDVKADEAGTGKQALEALRSGGYDCVVLDLGLPDMHGGELLAQLEREGVELPPVIVYTARDLTYEEEAGLREHAESIVIKDVRSQERLLDEVSLFLHRVVSRMPERKRKIIQDLHDTDELLRDKKVLVVDDDMRTVFAVSRLLSQRGMKPLKAENGERALRLLDEEPEVALVLMDIMMPVMDGYETMKRIRAQERFRKLPIIALTAKAMPEDREKCLSAGANDYMPKPVEEGRLLSMMRVWLYR